ncbi:MAG: hypothetical protein HKM95_12140, partial [Inquilinus sp.]|nr:hypothetical protein [Inquilinus sp.]
LDVAGTLDCDDAPGAVLAALRAGTKEVVFLGDAGIAAKLSAIADQSGAVLRTERQPALDPRHARDKRGACREWLASGD